MQELEITKGRVVPIWWLLVWRGLLGGWLIAIALAFLAGEIGARLGAEFSTAAAIATALSWVAGLSWGFVVIRMALKKNYKEFRLALVKKS